MPRESTALFKCSYFDIIVKPTMKLINKVPLQNDIPKLNFLTHALKNILKIWLQAEPNLFPEINSKICDMLHNNKM